MISSMLDEQGLVIHLNDRHETVFGERGATQSLFPAFSGADLSVRLIDRAFFVDTTSFSGSKRISRLNAACQSFAKHGAWFSGSREVCSAPGANASSVDFNRLSRPSASSNTELLEGCEIGQRHLTSKHDPY
jgi:hypothetical protein